MKVLILGGNSMLAYAIKQVFSFTKVISMSHKTCDITNFPHVKSQIETIRPDVVINCAAYTNVDKAELEPDLCELVNAIAVENIAQACQQISAILVHFSTEMVFGQESEQPYFESDEPINPLNVYGKTKLKGEKFVSQIMKKYYIVRTSWMFGPNGNNFVNKVINRAKIDKTIDVVNDQKGCPTYTFDLARAVYDLVLDGASFGIYHLINNGHATRAKFALEILDHTYVECKVNQIASDDILSAAHRPKNGILLNTKRKLLPNWTNAMIEYMVGANMITNI